MAILSKFPQFNSDTYDGYKMRVFVDMLTRAISQINNAILAKRFNFRARRTTNQSINSGSATVVQFVTEDWDIDSAYSTANYRFTPGIEGYYSITAQVLLSSIDNGKYAVIALRKNGSNEIVGLKNFNTTGGASDTGSFVSGIIFLDENDYIDVTIEHDHGSARNISASSTQNFFTAHKVG